MSELELNRVEVLAQVVDGQLTAEAAATLLDLTKRQVFRLLRRFSEDGPSGIRHKARGRAPNNRFRDAKRDYALELIREGYALGVTTKIVLCVYVLVAQGTVRDLSLIHISEPTRPY